MPLEANWIALAETGVKRPELPLCPTPKERTPLAGEPIELSFESTVDSPSREHLQILERGLGHKLRRGDEQAVIRFRVDERTCPPVAGGYTLRVSDGHIDLAGYDEAGLYYALATLLQLAREGEIAPVQIRDWPTFPIRGVMLHTGANSGPTHRRLVRDVIAPLKLNTLLLECEYAKWESHPELWSEQLSVSKEELKETVAVCRDHFVQPVPLIQTLSHMGWFYQNGQNKDVPAELMEYHFPVDDESAWSVVFDIYAEAIEVFQPEWLHVGFDEIRSVRERYPGSERTTREVILKSAERVHGWVADRGVKTMMWGDMLVHRTQASEVGLAPTPEFGAFLREHLPQDILILNWQYEAKSEDSYPELKLFEKAGLSVVAAPWYHAPTTLGQAKALAAIDGVGVVQTTWPGRVLNDRVVEGSQFHQFAALTQTAEAAWNGGEGNLIEEPGRLFKQFWDPAAERTISGSGWTAVLTARSASSKDVEGFAGVNFHLNEGVDLGSGRDIAVAKKARFFAFLWACNGSVEDGRTVAKLEVTYQNGDRLQVDLRARKEIDEVGSTLEAYQAPVAWRSDGGSVVRRWIWENPKPNMSVASIAIRRVGKAPPVILYGLSVVDSN